MSLWTQIREMFKPRPADERPQFGGAGATGEWDGDPYTHPNVRAFLDMISSCEGTHGPNGYRALFGFLESVQSPVFESFADHPRQRFQFRQTDGKINYTTAAGRYQFIAPTWDETAAQIRAPNFSPEWQDRGAIQRIRYRGALDDVIAGRIATAIDKCSLEWASLPCSKYPQPKRSFSFARAAYLAAGGKESA